MSDLFAPPGLGTDARAAIVNRTHRVVRQRATMLESRRRTVRSLMLPLVICSAMLILVCQAIWSTFGQAANGMDDDTGRLFGGLATDANNTLYLLLIWFLPVGVLTLAALVMRRFQASQKSEETYP